MIYSQQQLDIINSKDRRVMVNSVAGSGKTTTIKGIVNRAISSGVPPNEILVCTFTRKMAKELQDSNRRISWCDTIHGISMRIVDEHKEDAGYQRMVLIDEVEDREIIKNTISRNYLKITQRAAAEVLQEYCNTGKMPDSNKQGEIFLKAYLREIRSRDFITYGLLEYYAKLILSKHPEIGFRLVVVDEYQDTSCIENDLINLLAKDRLIVVGDVMQSIYGFRGADVGNMARMDTDIVYQMNKSYRVPANISDLANRLIEQNDMGYKLRIKSHTEGGTLRVVENMGAQTLYDEIELALKFYSPGEIYILTRTNRQIDYITHEMPGIPVDKELSAVKNMKYLSYLDAAFKAYYNGYYNYGLVRLLRLLDYRDAQIIAWENSGKNIYSMVKNDPMLKEFNAIMTNSQEFMGKVESILPLFEKRRGEYDTMMVKVLPYLEGINSPLDYMEWYLNMSVADFMPKDKIAVITVHMAKGMETQAVLIPFVEDGLFPNSRSSYQEELRLFYVAVTRAREYLSIMHRESTFLEVKDGKKT